MGINTLEKRASEISLSETSKHPEYRTGDVDKNTKYYTCFAEMYLEKPAEIKAGASCTMCTWRGIPTIDDW